MPGPEDEGISDTTKKKKVIRVSNPNKKAAYTGSPVKS